MRGLVTVLFWLAVGVALGAAGAVWSIGNPDKVALVAEWLPRQAPMPRTAPQPAAMQVVGACPERDMVEAQNREIQSLNRQITERQATTLAAAQSCTEADALRRQVTQLRTQILTLSDQLLSVAHQRGQP